MGRPHKDVEELDITARPKGIAQELGDTQRHEPGLSVDPEDLGRQFLSEATEQHNFESESAGEELDLELSAAASTDDALPGPNFEGDRSIWENTVSLALQNGGVEHAQDEVAPPTSSDEEDDQHDGLRTLSDEQNIDLTEGAIQEASLLDYEGDELGEIESPTLRTDDNKSHAKKRGGHAPKGARTPPRPR